MAAPFTVEHCPDCGRTTQHWYKTGGIPPEVVGAACEVCGACVSTGPRDDEYVITVTSMAGRSSGESRGEREYWLQMLKVAGSEAEALALGLQHARRINGRVGMPPHYIQVSDEELVRHATVVPAKLAEQSDAADRPRD